MAYVVSIGTVYCLRHEFLACLHSNLNSETQEAGGPRIVKRKKSNFPALEGNLQSCMTNLAREPPNREGEEIMRDAQEWITIGILDRYVSPSKIERNRQGRLRVYDSQESREETETFLNFDDLGEKNLSWLRCVRLTTTDPAIVSEYDNALKRKRYRKTVRVVVSEGIAEVDEDTLPDEWCYEIIDEDEEEEQE
jgi:hypothetical protein